MLHRRLSNFGKVNSFVISIIRLSYFSETCLDKIRRANNFGRLVHFGDCDGGAKSFFPGPSNAFQSYFNGNKEYERRFYSSDSSDSYPGSDYWRQLKRDNLLRS